MRKYVFGEITRIRRIFPHDLPTVSKIAVGDCFSDPHNFYILLSRRFVKDVR